MITLDMAAEGETIFRRRFAEHCRGFAPDKAACEAAAIAIYAAMERARPALAAATRRAKTPKAVECEASQSGPKGNANA